MEFSNYTWLSFSALSSLPDSSFLWWSPNTTENKVVSTPEHISKYGSVMKKSASAKEKQPIYEKENEEPEESENFSPLTNKNNNRTEKLRKLIRQSISVNPVGM